MAEFRCTRCNTLLLPNTKFCTECGMNVREMVFPAAAAKPKTEENTSVKRSFHIDEFNWDTNGYPTAERKKTEDIDFNWGSFAENKRKAQRGEEIDDVIDFYKPSREELPEDVPEESAPKLGLIDLEEPKTLDDIMDEYITENPELAEGVFEPEIPEEPELPEGAIEIDGFNENGEPKSLEELLKELNGELEHVNKAVQNVGDVQENKATEAEEIEDAEESLEAIEEADSEAADALEISDEMSNEMANAIADDTADELEEVPVDEAIAKTRRWDKKSFDELLDKHEEPEITELVPEGTEQADESAAEELEEETATELDKADAASVSDDLSLEELVDTPAAGAEESEDKIDKFYTYSKKNEEFQALLDEEYRRIKNNDKTPEQLEAERKANEEKQRKAEKQRQKAAEEKERRTREFQDIFKDDDEEEEKEKVKKPAKKHRGLSILGTILLVLIIICIVAICLRRFAPNFIVTQYIDIIIDKIAGLFNR